MYTNPTRQVFTNPNALKPDKTQTKVTEEVAARLATVERNLSDCNTIPV